MMDNSPTRGDVIPLDDAMYPRPRYVTQPQDHFDTTNKKTWQQAYYVNDQHFVKGSDAPVFLCVGGEGPPLDGSVVVSSVHCNVAVEWLPATKALMIAVEHRYYGCHNMSACPYSREEQTLKYLSSRQAVEDLANAHAHVVKEYGLTAKNKWISWGGSYPGMLASFFRIRHPELVHATVASSAPVIAQVDMPEYNNIVAAAYGLTSVGGSPACTEAIRKGHADIGTMMNTTAGRKKLSELFSVPSTDLETREGQTNFSGNGVAYFPAQGNDPTCQSPGCNINEICKVMADTTKGTEVERLAQLRDAQQASADVVQSRGKAVGDITSMDYWTYQTCTEFGFYQTCEIGSKCFYTQGLLLLDSFTKDCEKYKITVPEIEANIKATNALYGADHPNSTRILYPNGDVDPWHGLSKLKASPGLPVLMVSGASHHAWTHPSAPTDQKSVVAARAAIRKQVGAWLAEE
jgi:hypothetical protein